MQNNPEILIVNVQRTTFTNSTVGKSMQAVSIPRYLDVTPWLEPHQFNAGSVAKPLHLSCTCGKRYDKWYKFNDNTVTPCSLTAVNDADTMKYIEEEEDEFNVRPTPYIMLYELDYTKSVHNNGRIAMNPAQGVNADTRPPTWYSTRTHRTRVPPVLERPGDGDMVHSKAMPKETGHPMAEMKMSVKIDNEVFQMPRSFIQHFNINPKRLVEIKASIVVEDSNNVIKEMDLAKAYVDAVEDQRIRDKMPGRRTAAKLTKPKKTWAMRWRIFKRYCQTASNFEARGAVLG